MRKLLSFFFLLASLQSLGEEGRLLARYDEINGGLQGHITQVLQDRKGMIWVSTWNGLCRFDGYEFHQFKPQAGDGCSMSSNRLRDIWLSEQGDIFCKTDEGVYLFEMSTFHFRDLTGKEEEENAERSHRNLGQRGRFNGKFIEFTDRQGLQWQVRDNALLCLSNLQRPEQMLYMERPSMVRLTSQDGKKRLWVSTKQDATLRLLTGKGRLLGYLTPQGTLSLSYCSFAGAVYCMCQLRNGDIWLGCKPDGLFRLREKSEGNFRVEPVGGLDCPNVYSLAEDNQGRLWIATLGGGLAVIEQPAAEKPMVTNRISGYPEKNGQLIRHLCITPDNTLLAATTEGLVVGQLEKETMKSCFRLHEREPHRQSSLSCNATMNVVRTMTGRIFVSTETGGICEIQNENLLSDTLSFRCYDREWGLPTDMMVSMAEADDGQLLLAGTTQLMLVDVEQGSCRVFSSNFFHHPYYFSEAVPVRLNDGRWLFGTTENAFFLSQEKLQTNSYQPPLVLTDMSVGKLNDLTVDCMDTLTLTSSQRNLTIRFAALDYAAPNAISYQYRLSRDSMTAWSTIGHEHAVTFIELDPGTYQLALRSTNANGQWTDNVRKLTIIVKPTFWETPWAVLLWGSIVLMVVLIIVYTYSYIKRIERQRQETLEKYLTLLEEASSQKSFLRDSLSQPQETETTPSQFQQSLLAFVEANIGNSEADVGQMAEACAVSRSVLQRKMKSLMGISPADFLREARLKRAAQLLRQSDLTVSEIAYKCGFSDPKYFSRCFKQSLGASPSDYKVGFVD